MPTVLRLRNEKGNPSVIGWGKHANKDVAWILENDPAYLRFLYFNIRSAHLKADLCEALGLDAGIAFKKRKEHYNVQYNFKERPWTNQKTKNKSSS